MSSQFLCSLNLRAVRSGFFARTIPAGTLLSALLFLLAAAPLAAAPIALVLDTASTQNFNTLPQSGSMAWANDSTIPGWYSVRTGTGTTIVADTGGSNGGNLYSYGSAAAITDRALGTLGSSNAAAGSFFHGVALHNGTGATITSLDVVYTGEEWRSGGPTSGAQTIAFSYLVGTPTVTGSLAEFQLAGNPVTSLDFTSPINNATAGALDGNVAANRVTKTFTITGLSIADGTDVMLRWSDPDHSGTDHGLAIDDFSVTPHGSAPLPTLSIDDVSHSEGNAGTTTYTFTVTLSALSASNVTFDIATADNSATQPSDYTQKALTTQTIPAGSTSYTFSVLVNGDTSPETSETFFVNLSNASGATVADGQGAGTIVNDDAAPSLTIADVSHNEGNAGTTTYTFTVSLDSPAPAGGVTFDIATADGTATSPSDFTSRSLTAQTIPAGSSTYTFNVDVNGDLTSEPDETFTVNVSNLANAILTDGQAVGTIVNDDIQKIHDVQGNGAATPIPGATVTVEGVVTATFLGSTKLSGFFLQEEDADADADPNTSEGIFVFCTTCADGSVAEGQRVRATGVVSEFFNMTELTPASPAGVVVTDAGNHLAEVTPATITLPIAGDVDAFYEAREAMLVTYNDTLTVSEYFELPRYGQIELVQGARPRTFTEDNAPSVAGLAAHLDALNRRHVILDDDNNVQNSVLTHPNGQQAMYWPHANGGFSVGTQGADFFRGGDTVNNLTGVLHWSFAGLTGTDAWRIRPTSAHPVAFTPANPRPVTPPAVGGSIRAVGMNLLNYFTTIDTTSSSSSGPCGPDGTQDCRGADSVAELNRQRERASIVVCTLNPDVAGFMELENTTPSATITDLLGAINARCGGAHPYAFVNTGGTLGTDAIRVQLVYRTGVLSPVGSVLVDLDAIHNRPPTAQTFDVVDAANPAFGKRFTVIANHFKSKGSCPASGADTDQLDGQGCWAQTRTAQANRLMTWINSTVIPAAGDPDVLLLGDFNSYAHETPVTTLEAGGYHDLETELHGTDAYSYQFDGEVGHLDFAFANASLQAQITGADAWHINADEVPSLDYNDEIRDTGEAAQEEKPDGSALLPPRVVFQPATPYRASDHDPVVVGLFGSTDVAISMTDAPDPVTAGNNLTYTITATNNGPLDADAAAWSDTLPAGTTFTSLVTPSGWSCTNPGVGSGGTINCNAVGAFAPGSKVFTLVVAVSSSVAGGTVIHNTATITTSTSDSNPANNSATAATTVSAASQGNLVIAPTTLTFANQLVGTTSAAQTVTLSNNGAASLDVTALTAASGAFARSGGSCAAAPPITLAAGANCTLQYTFTPSATGVVNQSLTVTANAPASGTIALSGTGVQGNLTITPSSVPFGNLTVGSTSAAQTVTLANDGTASLQVTTLSPAAAPFARSGGSCAAAPPITIAAGANCTLQYTFTPLTAGTANQVLNVIANAPGSGTIALSGMGMTPQADVSLTITDGRQYVRVGESLNYTIVVTNAGPAAATATVGDALPATLSGGAWTCTPSGAATCANGSGNVLSDVATLPSGTHVTYVYSATVQLNAIEVIDNSATATVGAGAVDPDTGNNSASDATDVIVIFKDGFEDGGTTLALDGSADGFASAQLQLDASLLAGVGVSPVTIATGETADARAAFTLELARFNGQYAMRLVASTTEGNERSEWHAVDLGSRAVELAWQSAAAGHADGYLHVAAGGATLQLVARSESAHLMRLRVAVDGGLPWLSLMAR